MDTQTIKARDLRVGDAIDQRPVDGRFWYVTMLLAPIDEWDGFVRFICETIDSEETDEGLIRPDDDITIMRRASPVDSPVSGGA